ncbi:MAG: cation transporter [Methanomicrobiales archaeon]
MYWRASSRWGAITLVARLPSKERAYGFLRAEIFATFINSLLLIAVSAIILWEAYQRLLNPAPIQSGLMWGCGGDRSHYQYLCGISSAWEP